MTIKQLYPTQRPALDLNFAQQKRLDSRVSLTRASIGTYVGSDGLIKTAAANEARFDHDPETGESLGLLVEEQSTNVTRPSDFSQYFTYTSTGDGILTRNYGTAPDGTTSSCLYQPNSATRVARNTTGSGITAGTYTVSLYYKGDKPIYIAGPGVSAPLSDIQTLSGGWKRAAATATFTGGGYLDIYMSAGTSVELWGIQSELGSFHTSYIPTTSSTVTRSADVASLTNSNIYDTDSFTILNEPFGSAAGASTLSLVGAGETPIKRTAVYSQDLTQTQINASVGKTDEFWRWRILGSSFGLPDFATDGQVTVDWGDGTVETLTTSDHTFTDGGGYHDVGFRLDSGTYFRPYIANNGSHNTKVVALGPAPESMKLNGLQAFRGCTALESFDATVDATGGTSFSDAWNGCNSLTSFPLIDTSSVTSFVSAWIGCDSLTSFPLIDTSSGTNFTNTWYNCSSLTSFPLIDTSSGTNFNRTWLGCTSLTSFPAINTSSGTNFGSAWQGCNSLTSFPLIDTSSGTAFSTAWNNCNSLTSFPLIDTSSGTNFQQTWYNCNDLTSFPLIDTSSGTNFYGTWGYCTSLTSFPLINTSSGTDFTSAWAGCNSLTSFPLIDTSSGTNFKQAWQVCTSLTSFPANFFDSWTGTPANNCFYLAWNGCSSLTATSVENILNSIDTSGQSAPASGVDITIDYDTGTGTPSISTAVTNLKSRGWTITLNGVAQ